MSFGGDKSIQNIVGVGVGRRELPFHTYRVSVWDVERFKGYGNGCIIAVNCTLKMENCTHIWI
jgi:hypothetical protein